MTQRISFEDARRQLGGGQEEALLRKLYLAGGGEESGWESFQAILRGELRIGLHDATVKLVDANGRFIPPKGMTGVVDANRTFHLVQPPLNYEDRLVRLQRSFTEGMTFVSASEFEARAQAILERVKRDSQVANLLKGVHLPICFPQLAVADYGTVLEDTFLSAVRRSYVQQFPIRPFNNYRKGELAGKVTVVPESLHHLLIDKMADGPVVGVYFPTALQGFGIEDDRQMARSFPLDCMLSGAMDMAAAMVAYPDVLARDVNTPALDCAANEWRGPEDSLYFRANDGSLSFGYRNLAANDLCSGGVLLLG